jgi:TP901 family phage tail tape measure protein
MSEIKQKLGFDAGAAINTLGKLSEALDKANNSLRKMDAASKAAKSLDNVEKKTKNTTKAANEFLVSWKTIIRVLETQLIVRGLNTIITGFKEAVESARELGLAIEEVRTIDAAGRTAQDISEQVLRLSDAIGQAPTDLAEGLYQTLSNQVVDAADSFQLMSEAAKLAKVTASETGDAVNALSSVMNSYNLSASQAEHVSGTLFATVEQGRLRLGEIANVIGRVTPLTAQLGITWEETAASIATMTRQGVRADTAITQLRAVVTRLLKPTDEMREIFHKWGVQDGKQAIQTFDGLSGVLSKLMEETGGTSQGMSELLRNVRAIAGVFGIMSNEGKTMEEVLGNITTATVKATDAWAEYSKSDAQKLTVEMQKFENVMTRIGTSALPTITTYLSGLNTGLKGLGTGIQIVTGTWSEADKAAARYAASVRKGIKDGIKLQKRLAKVNKGAYDVITKASLKYYAEANKQEQKLATVRDNAIASATAAFESVADQLTGMYSDNLKKIENFVNQAATEVEKSLGRIADIRRDMEDRALEYNLEATKSNYKKLELLNNDYLKKLKKLNKAAAEISADPESIKKVGEAHKDLEGSLDRRVNFLKRIGASEEAIEKNFDRRRKHQKDLIGYERQFIKESDKVAHNTEESRKNFTDSEARAKEIVERMKEIHSQGEVSPMDQAELDSLQIELDAVIEKGKEAAKVFEDLGLDINFTEVVDGLTNALNQAHKDWQEEVRRAQEVFSKATLLISVALDTEGARTQFQQIADMQPLPGDTAAGFQARVDERATKVLQDAAQADADILVLEEKRAGPLQNTIDLMGRIGALNRDDLANLQFRQTALGKISNLFGNAYAAESQRNQEQVSGALELQNAYGGVAEALRQGETVSAKHLQHLSNQAQAAYNANLITREQLDLYKQADTQLGNLTQSQEQLNQVKEQAPDEELVKSAANVLTQARNTVEAAKEEASARDRVKAGVDAAVPVLDSIKQKTEGTANAADRGAKATGNAADQAGNFNTNISGAASPLKVAVSLSEKVAENMAAAAASSAEMALAAAGGASATAYHGGPHYADGGMFRGQDRQLTALAKGEMVTNQKNSRRFFSELNAMNQGSQPVYREQGGPVTNVGDVNVTVQGGDSSQQTVREIGHALRREIKRGNLRLR